MEKKEGKFSAESYLNEAGKSGSIKAGDVINIPIDKIAPNAHQPRKTFRKDTLEELAANIRERGVLQPITVRTIKDPQGEAVFEIVMGERRWRATVMAGLSVIPSIIREVPDNRMRTEALIENVQREDMSFLDVIRGCVDLKEELGSTDEVAKKISKDKKTVEKYCKIHEEICSLPDIVTLFESHALKIDRTFAEGFCKVVGDIRRVHKSDKRDYTRVLKGITTRLEEEKKPDKGIKAINPWLMSRFKKDNGKKPESTTEMLRETDAKLVLHIEVPKGVPVSPELDEQMKSAIATFTEKYSSMLPVTPETE